jgi:hypothetical protein
MSHLVSRKVQHTRGDLTGTFLASTHLELRSQFEMRSRRKQPASPPPPENNQEQVDTNDNEQLPTTTTRKQKPAAKRNRPADVDTSKPVSSPKRKKKKAGIVGVIRQPLTEDTENDPIPAPPPARRPQPRLRKAPGATSMAAKAQSTGDDVTSNLASLPEDTDNEKQQRVAAALIDAGVKATQANQKSKERGDLARRMLADQNRDDATDSSEEEDAGSNDAEQMPATKRGGASKVR